MTPIRALTTALALLAIALPAQAAGEPQREDHGQEGRGRQEQARPQAREPRGPAREPRGAARPEGPRGMEGARPQRMGPGEGTRAPQPRGVETRPGGRGRTLSEPQRGREPSREQYPSRLRPRQEARGWQRDHGWERNGAWAPRNSWLEHRSRDWQAEHRSWRQRGGYGGYYIPRDRFYSYYGPRHLFRFRPVIHLGYPRFVYGPYTFLIVDPWPWDWDEGWYDDGDCYIDFVDDGYYLFNRRHPGVSLAITVSF